MTRSSWLCFHLAMVMVIAAMFGTSSCQNSLPKPTPLDPQKLNQFLGKSGVWDAPSGAYRLVLHRVKKPIRVQGREIQSARTWEEQFSFTGSPDHALLIGDLPLLPSELTPVLRILSESGLEITALHNRFVNDEPRIYSVHFQGTGAAEALSKPVSQLVELLGPAEMLASGNGRGSLDIQWIHQTLWKGEWVGNSYRISTGKGTQLEGVPVGEGMSIQSWLEFSGKTHEAQVNGEIAMLESESSKVILELIRSGFEIVAIHSHLVKERPHLIFVHLMGNGPLEELAPKLKRVLQLEKSFRGST